MRYRNLSIGQIFKSGSAAPVLMAVAMFTIAEPAAADEASAKALFKSMSDYMTAQSVVAFSYDSTIEIVTADLLKVGLTSSGNLSMNRPDKLRLTRTGGLADVEMAYDGKTLTALGRNLKIFTSAEAPGTIDDLIDTLRFEYGVEAPAADLLSSSPFDTMMANVAEAIDLGSGVIGGQVCDHVAFRTAETDWQVWIAQGDKPYPCRFEITSKMTALAPSYQIDIYDWKSGAEVAETAFKIEAGDNKVVKSEAFEDMDEVKTLLAEGMSE
jgi:hypothetical protein